MNDALNFIPRPDPFGIPGSPWLFVCLLLLTQTVHVLFMNFVLGGSWFLVWLGTVGAPQWRSRLYRRCLNVMPIAISSAITFGVAPLLFVQVLYGHFFYTANILMGWYWLSVLVLLLIGFYLVYILKAQKPDSSEYRLGGKGIRFLVHLVVALAFTGVALLMTTNAVLVIHPDRWPEAFRSSTTLLVWEEIRIFWPRFLHNLFGSLSVTGIWILWIANHRGSVEPEKGGRTGAILATTAAVIQMPIGFWYLFSLPSEILKEIMGFTTFAGQHLMIGILFAVGGLFAKILLIVIPTHRKTLWVATVLTCLNVMTMITVNEGLRQLLLADLFQLADWKQNPQTELIFVFLILFACGLGVLAWIARTVWLGFKPSGK